MFKQHSWGTAAILATAVGISMGSVAQAQIEPAPMWLASGTTGYPDMSNYHEGMVIHANCDMHCHDLDLFLYDDRGHLVAQHATDNDQPYIVVPYDGDFAVGVFMDYCDGDACEAWISYSY